MSIRATILAGVLAMPLVAVAALAADTGNLSLANAAKQGDRDAVRSLLNGPAKNDVGGAEGGAALICGGLPQRPGDGRSSLARGRRPEGRQRIRRNRALCRGRGQTRIRP